MSEATKPTLLDDTTVRIGTVFFLVVISPYLFPSFSEETLIVYGRLFIEVLLLIMVIVVIQYGLQRIEDRAERRFWNLWSLGLAAWLLQGLLALATESEASRSVTTDIAFDSLFYLFYVFLALGLESQPHLSSEHVSTRLRLFDWLGVCTFFLGILLYFVVVPRVFEPESYLRSSWLFYVLIDLYLVIRLAGFVHVAGDRRWRRIYAWLLAASVAWLFSDSIGLLTLNGAVEFQVQTSSVPIGVSWFLSILLAARSRELRGKVTDTACGNSLQRSSQVGPLVFYAMMFPLMHFGFAKAELLTPSLTPIRETLVLVFLVLLSALAYVYQRLLEAENRRLEVKRVETANALNQQLVRTQKMDAIGQLTGGIAHDFNNILAIILGNLEMLELELRADDKAAGFLRPVQEAAQRAAELTQKLLIFSGNRAVTLSVTNVNRLVADMDSLIARSLPPEVKIEHQLAEDLWSTEINAGDFEDALVNLVLNARDAMSGVGTLTLQTHNRILDDDYCAENPGATPGEYVELVVNDTGEGLSSEQQQHLFEPFYTTRDTGTGLGLATVYGFTKRSGGYVTAHSDIDVGTTIRIYLPRAVAEEPLQESVDGESKALLPRGSSQTLLVVDDEEALLELARTQLESLGYRVLVAGNGRQALTVLADETRVDLLFSDIVMPGGMNGYELAEQATAIHPGLQVLLVSGYEQNVSVPNSESRVTAHLLTKPYNLTELAKRVREVLDNRPDVA